MFADALASQGRAPLRVSPRQAVRRRPPPPMRAQLFAQPGGIGDKHQGSGRYCEFLMKPPLNSRVSCLQRHIASDRKKEKKIILQEFFLWGRSWIIYCAKLLGFLFLFFIYFILIRIKIPFFSSSFQEVATSRPAPPAQLLAPSPITHHIYSKQNATTTNMGAGVSWLSNILWAKKEIRILILGLVWQHHPSPLVHLGGRAKTVL